MPAPLLVTIATQRSGTKFLVAALNAGTRLRSFGEAFKPPPPETPFPAFVRRAFRRHAAWLELAYPDVIVGDALAPAACARIAGLLGLPAEGIAGPSRFVATAPDKAQAITNWGGLLALEARIRAERGDPPPPPDA